MSMLSGSSLVAFVATAAPEKALHFYGSVLELRLVEDTPFAMVFDANGTTLRVQKVQQVAAPPYTVLGWTVADIRAVARGLATAGVTFERFGGMPQDTQGIWASPSGALVAWFRDPDGNTLSLTQLGS
jgi:catechol 2,3-dioxygenase-like lactoylglutathione lyase family enzyme